MNSTTNLTITAQTAWDTWYAFSDRACNDTATAYRWYVATFFSEAASRRYQWIGQMIACLAYLAFLYGKQLRTRYEAVMAVQVQQTPTVEELMSEVVASPLPPLTQYFKTCTGVIKLAVNTKFLALKEALVTALMDQ